MKTRCIAITRYTKRQCAHPANGSGLCTRHKGMVFDGDVLRLTGNRQARIAYDINGSNPQVRLAPVGDDSRQERTA